MKLNLRVLEMGLAMIIAAVGSFFMYGWIMAVIALVLGSAAIREAARWDQKHRPAQTEGGESPPPIT